MREKRSDRIPNRYVRGSMKITEVKSKIKEKRLRWFGHIERRKEDHYLKRVQQMELAGRRRGRPKTRWKDCARRDVEKNCINTRDCADVL